MVLIFLLKIVIHGCLEFFFGGIHSKNVNSDDHQGVGTTEKHMFLPFSLLFYSFLYCLNLYHLCGFFFFFK
jgi:hypothetical protein